VRAAVEQLDIRPLQVLIEVLIAEVRKDGGFSLGMETFLPETAVPGTTNTVVDGTNEGLGLGEFVLRVMNLGGYDLDLTLSAAASRGDVSILSRPVVLTTNNEPAEVVVGSQRPFIQVQRTLATDAATRDQVVQYMDVGTQLSVTPTISEDGYVMLEVVQEVNAATTETAYDAPVISTRSVQTHLLVRDGQTAVLGGLTDRQEDVTRAGVPILSRIPILGWLFGRSIHRTTETELFVFLTPRVIRGDDELDAASGDVRESARGNRDALEKAIEESPARRGRAPEEAVPQLPEAVQAPEVIQQ
jgi:general secretion pathway protein D